MKLLTLLLLCLLPVTAAEIEINARNNSGTIVATTTIAISSEVLTALNQYRSKSVTLRLPCETLPLYPHPDQYACTESEQLMQWDGLAWQDQGPYGYGTLPRFPSTRSLLHTMLRDALRNILESEPIPAMQTHDTDTVRRERKKAKEAAVK